MVRLVSAPLVSGIVMVGTTTGSVVLSGMVLSLG
jgi:hypothetical protein